MRYTEFRESLKDFTVFSINSIKNIDKSFHRRRLNEWQDKGYIKKIIRGYYIFSDLALDENILFEIANRIYEPSYISFEMALSYYNLIPEITYGITSASTRKTHTFKTIVAGFIYRTVKPELFFGYDIVNHNGKNFKIAVPEKAILDYFYINPAMKTEDDFISMRLNKNIFFELIDEKKLKTFMRKIGNASLGKRMRNFLEFIKNA